MSVLTDVGVGAVTSLVGFGAGRGYHVHIRPRLDKRRRGLRALVPFDLRKNAPIVVTYGAVADPQRAGRYSVEDGDVTALMRANQIAAWIASHERVLLKPAQSLIASLELHRNVFSISGPKWNPAAHRLIGALGSPIDFAGDERALVVLTREQEDEGVAAESYKTDREPGSLATTCHGLIVAGEREIPDQDQRQRVMIATGRTTLSTHAALLFLSLLASSKERQRSLRDNGIEPGSPWAVLLRVDREVYDIDLGERPLDEADVKITVLRSFTARDFRQPFRSAYKPKGTL